MFVQGAEGHGDQSHAFRGTEAKAKQRHGQNQQIRLRQRSLANRPQTPQENPGKTGGFFFLSNK